MSGNELRLFNEIETELRARGFTPLPEGSKRLLPIMNSGNYPQGLQTGRDLFYENECTYCGTPVRVFATSINGTINIYLLQP
jgi:hypothetical protein